MIWEEGIEQTMHAVQSGKTVPLTVGADGMVQFDKVVKPLGSAKYVQSNFTDLIVS